MSRARGRWAVLPLPLLLLACEGMLPWLDTGAILVLRPDPALAREQDLAARLAAVQVLLDAPDGFAQLPQDADEVNGFSVTDVDGDAEAELLLELSTGGREELPRVRLDPGHNEAKRIAVRARGLDAQGRLVAYGGVEPRVLFASGRVNEVEVPFNPARAVMPPRVIAVLPTALPTAGFVLGKVAFVSSRALAPESLEGRVSLQLYADDDSATQVEGVLAGPVGCPDGTQMWTFAPTACHTPATSYVRFELTLAEGVADTDGAPLRDAEGQAGAVLSVSANLAGLGPCVPVETCDRYGRFGELPPVDLSCDRSTGLFEPAQCTVAPGGCLDPRDGYDGAEGSDDATCAGYRPDAFSHAGRCVVADPWTCRNFQDCEIMDSTCDMSSRQCQPQDCDGACAGAYELCTPRGCLPVLGTCAESCATHGSCPSFAQTCRAGEGGGRVCR